MTHVMVGFCGQFHMDLAMNPNFDVMDVMSYPCQPPGM